MPLKVGLPFRADQPGAWEQGVVGSEGVGDPMSLWARGSFAAPGVTPQGTRRRLQTRPALSSPPGCLGTGLRGLLERLGETCPA